MIDFGRKEAYRLWWEYLKRSDKYWEVCDLIEELTPGKDRPPPSHPLLDKPEGGWRPLTTTFFMFQDVRKDDFDDWWARIEIPAAETFQEQTEKELDKPMMAYNPVLPIDFAFAAGRELELSICRFVAANQREPSLRELIEYFPQYLKEDASSLYVVVDVSSGFTVEQLSSAFANAVRERRDHPQVRATNQWFSGLSDIAGRVNEDALKRYLKVYDLRREGRTMREVILEIGTKHHKDTCDNINVHRAYLQDLAKAKRIIENVEQGVFPGDYQPVTPERLALLPYLSV